MKLRSSAQIRDEYDPFAFLDCGRQAEQHLADALPEHDPFAAVEGIRILYVLCVHILFTLLISIGCSAECGRLRIVSYSGEKHRQELFEKLFKIACEHTMQSL